MATQNMVVLIREARAALNLHVDGNFARFLGVSRRTVQRHAATAGIPIGTGHTKLARALYPKNPGLALTIARSFNIDLSDLVAAAKPAAQAAPLTKPQAGREHLALVVLAACDALNLPPRDVRPALAAIFRQALALGVDMDQLAKLLAEGEPAKGKQTPKT